MHGYTHAHAHAHRYAGTHAHTHTGTQAHAHTHSHMLVSYEQALRKIDPEGAKRVDIVSLLDEFAANFYQELDYELECANGIRIAEEMRVLPRVKIPRNYPRVTSRRVHTAEWVDGEKLSQSTADDVGELVNLGVITYLTQLLEIGFFHADVREQDANRMPTPPRPPCPSVPTEHGPVTGGRGVTGGGASLGEAPMLITVCSRSDCGSPTRATCCARRTAN